MIEKLRHRDHTAKFHLYARIWDLRKGQYRKPFYEIARTIGISTSTIKTRFYRAFELIFGCSYDRERFKKLKKKVYKESLRRYCENCGERKICVDLCPDIAPFIMQDWRKRDRREVQPPENKPEVMAHLGLAK